MLNYNKKSPPRELHPGPLPFCLPKQYQGSTILLSQEGIIIVIIMDELKRLRKEA
jgi:hypothetical protein